MKSDQFGNDFVIHEVIAQTSKSYDKLLQILGKDSGGAGVVEVVKNANKVERDGG